jgi:predicted ATPase
MPELPSGTVTFLFTDIEGSTRLLHELGAEGYAEALDVHRRVLRRAFERYGGVEVDTQGDAFFVAFPTGPGALQAAAEGREGLASGSVRVRMGIHTGTPLLSEEGYVGVDVHRAARIAACGHGGQVLVTTATAALTGTDGLRDLGEHRLKDLSAPERIYQLGEDDFPPLKSLYRTNLPVPATVFLGREAELQEVTGLLAREDVRLLTLTGPGGTGKTRLALQAAASLADAYPDGVYWVPLAALRDPALVLQEASQALGAQDGLADHIKDKQLLLLFDNFEQVVEAASRLSELRAVCPNLDLLVTSRELLQLPGEQAYPVPPLAEEDGTALFLARARAADPGFGSTDAVLDLCGRLDNLPLAIELAASRVRVLTPEQLLERLSAKLDLLKAGRGVDPRQQTLRAAIEWSYDLLAEPEKRLFARLAVFRGGCTLEAAEEVADADLDLLQSLVDKSLLRHTEGRFWMLETIREYALERLEASGEGDALRGRHASHFATQTETADPHMRGGPEQRVWLERIEAEFDNVRAAMHWALDRDPETAVRLVASLDWFFWVRGRLTEAAAWLEQALASEGAREPRLRARALLAAAVVAQLLQDNPTQHADESFALYSDLGDEAGQASALRERGKAAVSRGDHARAAVLYQECIALAQRIGDVFDEAVARNNLGDIANREGRWEDAIELCSQSRSLRVDFGDRWGAALTLSNVAFAELQLGRLDEAERDLRQALREGFEIGSVAVVLACLGSLAALASGANHPSRAARLMGAEGAIEEESGIVLEGAELALHERTAASVRAALGDEAFALELEQGHRLSMDEAVEYALGDDG